ncbi:MAG: GNAT family N-acetyltransferase [Planctomycetaceae bacterium]
MSQTTAEKIPAVIVRPAEPDDAERGLLKVLDQISATGVAELSPERARTLIAEMAARGVEHVWVAVRDGRVVGAATLIVERKLIHGGGRAGRIEDVVVDQRLRQRGIGRLLIERLCELAAELGCYKIVLCCDASNMGFYERCGFRPHEVGMRKDLPRS